MKSFINKNIKKFLTLSLFIIATFVGLSFMPARVSALANYNGELIKTATSSGVYLVDNGAKRPFPSGPIFSSYFYHWSDIVTISTTDLGLIPDGAAMTDNVNYQDDQYLAKTADSSGVYLVDSEGKHAFPSGLIFSSYFYHWSDIVTVSTTALDDISSGAVMTYNVNYRDGQLIKTADSSAVYLVESGTKRVFLSGLIFSSNGYHWSDIVTISDIELGFIPDGAAVNQLTIADPTVTLTKPYDGGTTVATCTAGTLSGKVGTEVVTATCVATYANATVGTGKAINIVYTLAGADAAKYVKPVDGSVATGVITDITAPALTAVTHNETAKTITYTWSEPIQLCNDATTPCTESAVTAAKMDIYTVVNNVWNEGTLTAGVEITSATFDDTDTILTITYTGNLETTANTDYVVDSWGYDIIDMAGNRFTGEVGVSPVFTVDAIDPNISTSVTHNETAKTITYHFTEPVQFIDMDTETVVADAGLPAILKIFVVTDGDFGINTITPNATIQTAAFSSNNTVLTLTYTGNLVNMVSTNYIINPWTGTGNWAIRDLAGNDMTDNDGSLFTVAADTAKVISGVTAPAVGVAPVSAVTATDQYTGTVTWSPSVATDFVEGTVYTATIDLTAKSNYTFTGVPANFFTVAGASFVANPADSGVVTATFPVTALLNKAALTSAITAEVGATHGTPAYVLTEAGYTTATWATYKAAIDAAIVTEANTSATQTAVNAATALIASTKASLTTVADMTAYNAALAAVTQANYTTATWTTYQVVVTANAKTDQDLQATVNTATGNITTAQAALVTNAAADALTAAITTEVGAVHGTPVYVLTEAGYTTTTWATYEAAIDAAIVTEANTSATQTAVNAATALIASTKAALVTNVAADGLTAAKATESGLSSADYVDYSGVTTALALPEVTNTQILAKTTAINNAIAALVTNVAADNLAAAKVAANGKVEASYTPTSWATFAGARTAALAMNEVTNTEILAMAAALDDAIGDLVLKTSFTAIGAITGFTTVDQTLTAGTKTPVGATVDYQWQISDAADGTYVNIVGATNITYALLPTNVGKYLKVVATANGDYAGTATSAATTVVAPAAINIAAIPGVTAPATGETPVSAITATAQYTGAVEWAPSVSNFAETTIYTAYITLTPTTGYTLAGVGANFFTVDGTSTPATSAPHSGLVTAIFPITLAMNKVALTAAISAEVGATHGTPVHILIEADYTVGTWGPYNAAIDAAIATEANTSATQAAVDSATGLIASTKAALVTVLSVAKVTAKADVANALSGYTEGNYEVADWTTLNNFHTNGDIAIDAAGDLAAVATAKGIAIDGMAAVPTIAETLAAAKVTAHGVLTTLMTNTYHVGDYEAADWTTLTTARDNGDIAITAATTTADVTTAQNTATVAMDAVPTTAELVLAYTNAFDAAAVTVLLNASPNLLGLTLTNYAGLDATGKSDVAADLFAGQAGLTTKTLVQDAATAAIATAKGESDGRALAAAIGAANIETAKVAGSQSAYTTAGGSAEATVYTDVTTANANVASAIASNITADILSTTGTLTTKLGALDAAKTALDVAAVVADVLALADNSIKGVNSSLSNVTVALTNPLPSAGFVHDSTITWASSNIGVVSNDGQTINRPIFSAGDATVTLTATVTKGASSSSKAFTLTVIKLPASGVATVTSATYTVSPVEGGAGTITNVPAGTSSAVFLAALAKGESHQTWNSTGIAGTVLTGNTLVVTAENGTTVATYTVTVNG